MATGDVKTFTFDYGTLKFKVTATDNGNGTSQIRDYVFERICRRKRAVS